VSVNYWWNPIKSNEGDTSGTAKEKSVRSLAPNRFDKYSPVSQETIEVPPEIKLATKFNTLENARSRRFHNKEVTKIIPCQACGNSQHEYLECPYLGHYEVISICGQTCNYEAYRLKKPGKGCSTM